MEEYFLKKAIEGFEKMLSENKQMKEELEFVKFEKKKK